MRTISGMGPRVVRIGTHALKAGGGTSLWNRLRTHRGPLGGMDPGGGNHRASVFRLHVGTALIRRDQWPEEVVRDWGRGSSAPRRIREIERPLEHAVSKHVRCMPFLWIGIDDEPGPTSLRGCVERNAIALLSNYNLQDMPIDPPSSTWLGHWAASEKVRHSGLWNASHVADDHDPYFLDVLEELILSTWTTANSGWLPHAQGSRCVSQKAGCTHRSDGGSGFSPGRLRSSTLHRHP